MVDVTLFIFLISDLRLKINSVTRCDRVVPRFFVCYCSEENEEEVMLPEKNSPGNKQSYGLLSKFINKDTRLTEKHRRKFKEDAKQAIEKSIVVESSTFDAFHRSSRGRNSFDRSFNDEAEVDSSGDSIDEDVNNRDHSSAAAASRTVQEEDIENEEPQTETEVIDRFVDILDAETLQPIAWPSLKRSEKDRKRESHRSKAFLRKSMLFHSDSSDRNNTSFGYTSASHYERRVDPLRITVENDRSPFLTFLLGPRRVCVPSPVLLKFELHLSSHFGRTVRKNPFQGIPFENWKDLASELYWFGYDKRIQQRESMRKLEADSVKSFQSHWMTRLFTGALHKYVASVQRSIIVGKYNCDVIKYQWFHRGSCLFIESDLNGKQLINTRELTKGLVPEFAFDDDNKAFPEITRRNLNNFVHLYEEIAEWESTKGDADLVNAYCQYKVPFKHELDYIWNPNYWFDSYLPRDIFEQSVTLSTSEKSAPVKNSRNGIFSGRDMFSPVLVSIEDENENSINSPSLLWCPSHDNASILSSTESFRTDYSENSPFSAEEKENYRQSMEQNMVSLENSCEKSQALKFGIYNEKCFTVSLFSREAVNEYIVGTPKSSPRNSLNRRSFRNSTLGEETPFHYVLYPVTGRVEDLNGFFTVKYVLPSSRISMFYGEQRSLKGFTPQEGDLVKCINIASMIKRVARNAVLSRVLENPHFVREGVCLVGVHERSTFSR